MNRGSQDPAARAILESSMAMAQKLSLSTVAEGVESPSELAMMRDMDRRGVAIQRSRLGDGWDNAGQSGLADAGRCQHLYWRDDGQRWRVGGGLDERVWQ